MSNPTRKAKTKLKTFDVLYCVEQGFSIEAQARSDDEAERIIRDRLNEETDVLSGSTRVHYDGFTAGAEERAKRSRPKAGAR